MKNPILNIDRNSIGTIGAGRRAANFGFGGQQISDSEKKKDKGHKPSLVGVWVTQVTRRNCETGEPIAATNQIQFTFAKGGTLLRNYRPQYSSKSR